MPLTSCDVSGHEFDWESDWRQNMSVSDETIRIPIKCKACGFVADATYLFHGHTNKDTGEDLQC
jgi:hypothetical protein